MTYGWIEVVSVILAAGSLGEVQIFQFSKFVVQCATKIQTEGEEEKTNQH